MKKVFLITMLVLIIDQASKIYVKTHFRLGEYVELFPWFKLYFLENAGMAYGISIGKGYMGKICLSVFRLLLIAAMCWWIFKSIQKGASNYFLVPMGLILAGAIGNLLDSSLYGLLFDTGTTFNTSYGKWIGYGGVSKIKSPGYSFFMGGCVVDMLYFPIINIDIPKWVPRFGGKQFEFFQPVFNIADAAISIGVGSLFIFGKKASHPLYKHPKA